MILNYDVIIDYLKDKNSVRCGGNDEIIYTSFDTMPNEFIEFAENDLKSGLSHKYINALSNAKRALDCQADRLLKLFGYYDLSQKKFWGFPKKIELIQKFEIIAPRVLNKINRIRNLMEHQYIKPSAEQVEDFLDIVSLFVASTDYYLQNCTEIDYINEKSKYYKDFSEFIIYFDTKKINIKTYQFSSKTDLEYQANFNDQFYDEILKLHLKKIEHR